MKIAVTGGSGNVGRTVIDTALAQGHTVVSVDRADFPDAPPGVRSIVADIADFDGLARAFEGCEAMIHLAAYPSPRGRPDHLTHNNNVTGSYNALRAAVDVGITRICQSSSVNAIGLAYSREPTFDYFPIDEAHPNHAEDPYSLSKWICEQQADALARRYPVSIASLRLHWVVSDRDMARAHRRQHVEVARKDLWGYVMAPAVARACLAGVTTDLGGHEVFYIVAPDSLADLPSRTLAAQHFPGVPLRAPLDGHGSFFTTAKAERMLGWTHDL